MCPRISLLGKKMKIGNMEFVRFKELIDKNIPYLGAITLTGLGEPFLYPFLCQAVEYIRKKSVSVNLFLSTNASVPGVSSQTGDIADQIDHLQISIDGVGTTFESIRKNADFDSFSQNVKTISEKSGGRRVKLSFNMVVLKENYRQMTDVIRVAKMYDIRSIHFSTLNLAATDHDLSYYSFYFSKEYRKEIRRALWLALKSKVQVVFHHVGLRNEFRDCDMVWGNFSITWDGWLVPCCVKPFHREMNFGNVFQTSLADCINSREAIEFRQMALNGITPEFCKRCHRIYANMVEGCQSGPNLEVSFHPNLSMTHDSTAKFPSESTTRWPIAQ